MNRHHGEHGCCGGHGVAHGHAKVHTVTGCCGFQRRFMTKAERREALESYRDQLKNELTGVEERLQDFAA